MTKVAEQIKTLPAAPGVYFFKAASGKVLYIGKAKSLRSRVRSYFRPQAELDPAKQQMIPRIASIATITCDTETEALVLEANLIRQHQPPYNVVLRDDKFYLFIKITTNKEYQRVFPVRRITKDGSHYFGPYSSAASVRSTLKLLRRIFPHRGEKESPREKIFPHPLFATKAKSAPRSLGEVGSSRVDYNQNITNIIRFLQGHRQDIMDTLQTGMKEAAARKQFERAAIFRNQLQAIERLEGSQKVYLPRKESFDAISAAHLPGQNLSAVNVFQIRDGRLLNKNTFLMRHRGAAPAADVIRQFLLQYYSVAQDIPPIILVPVELSDAEEIAHWINADQAPRLLSPKRGRKRQLLAMGERNAEQLLNEQVAVFESDRTAKAAAEELARALGIASPLTRIETYDISNIQGTLATGSMIVFTKGQADKQHYRKFKVRLSGGPNDFAMLQEVLTRRLSDQHQDWPKPDLMVIDGGKGQLNAAVKVLTRLKVNVPVASLAKREETLFAASPGGVKEIHLPYDSPALFLVQRMRDEAHRFTLSYHQLLRQKHGRRSLLDEVPGIGPKTKKRLLSHFGSLKTIRQASREELSKLIGTARAKTLQDYL